MELSLQHMHICSETPELCNIFVTFCRPDAHTRGTTPHLSFVHMLTQFERIGLPTYAWLYKSNRFGPPQVSAELPLQAMSHPVSPSGAGPPPFSSLLSQSADISIVRHNPTESMEKEGQTHSIQQSIPPRQAYIQHSGRELDTLRP
jgi:hypothetical protein